MPGKPTEHHTDQIHWWAYQQARAGGHGGCTVQTEGDKSWGDLELWDLYLTLATFQTWGFPPTSINCD